MFSKRSLLLLVFFFGILCHGNAQSDTISSNNSSLTYEVELFGSVATKDFTPFWFTSNQYGKIPLETNNGYINPAITYHQSLSKDFYWNAVMDVVAVTPRRRKFYFQQIYAEAGYKSLLLRVGSKEDHKGFVDRYLSSGDMSYSGNARPIPEINLSLIRYVPFPGTKGWLQVKGEFAVGRSFDTGYLKSFVADNQEYVKDMLWHHKSLHFKINDSRRNGPFSLELGVNHWAQWGGTSSTRGKQPQSFKDFIRIVLSKSGSGGSTDSDQVNALGNHCGNYDIKFGYKFPNVSMQLYHQHFFEDKSGMIFRNGWDGLWGVELTFNKLPQLKKMVFEYVNTRNQSGPFHNIDFDHDKYPGHGGGNDNYYNNQDFVSGYSYFNRGLGNPLVLSPEYNKDGKLGFKCNRIRDFHLGAEGEILANLQYRLLFTFMEGWGTHDAPFLKKKTSTATMLQVSYQHSKLPDWNFIPSVGFDTGDLVKSTGVSLKIVKRGILKL